MEAAESGTGELVFRGDQGTINVPLADCCGAPVALRELRRRGLSAKVCPPLGEMGRLGDHMAGMNVPVVAPPAAAMWLPLPGAPSVEEGLYAAVKTAIPPIATGVSTLRRCLSS